jgi:hypothetical protein
MLLSNRQKTAQDLARSIGAMDGAFVISPSPLRDDVRGLRIQIMHPHCNRVLATLQDWGWKPVFAGNQPRICPDGWKLAAVYEIPIERERQLIADNTIRGELAEPHKKSDVEIEGMRRYLGIGGKK